MIAAMEYPADDPRLDPAADDVEVVDAVPVVAASAPLEPVRPAGQVVVRQAAAVAATSFGAGGGAAVRRGRGDGRPRARPSRPRRPPACAAHDGADRRLALVPRGRAPARPARLSPAFAPLIARRSPPVAVVSSGCPEHPGPGS